MDKSKEVTMTREEQEHLEHAVLFKNFCEETPEYGDENSRERKLADDVYTEKFQKLVQSKQLPYREALEQTRTEVDRRLAFEDMKHERNNKPVGKSPQFKTLPHSSEGKVSW
jgi:hypothetical protein